MTLISYAIGMLPLHLMVEEATGTEKATTHPLFRVLHREPNNWQTAFDFRTLMQLRALVKGNAYANVVRSRGRILALNPMDPDRTTPFQRADLSVAYKYRRPDGSEVIFEPADVLHLRGATLDGINGLSIVQQAREAIGLSLQQERAAARLFKNGVLAGSAMYMPEGKKLSDEAYNRLKASIEEKASAENAGKNLLLEEGLRFEKMAQTAVEAELIKARAHQVEEIARISGVPRPLLMMDETSWGSGIEALGRFFVTYALGPWFSAWEQAIERTLLTGSEKDVYAAKFNPGALLRGSLKDQGDFFAKALGAGGHKPFMEANEVRRLLDMNDHPDGSGLVNPMTQTTAPGGENDAAPA